MTDSSKNAWPGKQHAGSTADYDEYDTDRKAWIIDKGYDEHMSSANPRNTPRVEQGFWHQDQRTGRRVHYVPPESPRSYERRCDKYDAQQKTKPAPAQEQAHLATTGDNDLIRQIEEKEERIEKLKAAVHQTFPGFNFNI